MGTVDYEVTRPIDGRLEQHDSDQFEVKLDYTIDRSKVKNRYEVESYFFLPKSLRVDAHTYPSAQFYNDVQAYIRFKTPALSLKELGRIQGGSSPLSRVVASLNSPSQQAGPGTRQDEASRDLCLVGCLMRANLRDTCSELQQRLAGGSDFSSETSRAGAFLRADIQSLVQEARCVLAQYRLLRSHFSSPTFKPRLAQTYALVDEYMSLTLEGHLTALLRDLDQAASAEWPVHAERKLLSKTIVDERAHRLGSGYESTVDIHGSNETVVYRLGLLKKFVMSVLFLEITRDRDGHGTANLVAAIAAGLAMLLATLGSLGAQAVYGLNTLPFLLALVAGYIVKDRLKEWVKLYLGSKVSPWIADYRAKIFDPADGAVVGSCRERVVLCTTDSLPGAIVSARHGKRLHTLEAQSKQEIVVHYRKRVTIYARAFSGLDGQVDEINDIIRFSVSSFLTRMDDPQRSLLAYDTDKDLVREISGAKVYHINLVFVLRALDGNAAPRIEHARVILDKAGIRRITSNSSPTANSLQPPTSVAAPRSSVRTHGSAETYRVNALVHE